ncbi:thioredoxin-dependent thiol peroxidase [Alteribacillus iranensis]|uniref:thioredoxin-dependent peroxiredoxin n=1 Tax=Alteribacillus iranensis TaxID=930128 RepID=A0A1I2FAA0_9BACI|nr:thioredoxin-dependent thiol peroxidase [Alteribacillus iranensis]SFF01717.1 peroxiredoxin Q/BCP [Alteribacillus iranensis]
MKANVGEKAPEFSLPSSSGGEVSLADLKGKNVVLYFYPKDMTPGCTTEACDFRDYNKEFEQLETVILGVSPDPLDKHQKFIDKHDLPFPLLADEDKEVAELYDVWKLKKNFGKEYMGIVRSTFVIDKNGVLVKEWKNVKVKNHVNEVLNYIKEELQQ